MRERLKLLFFFALYWLAFMIVIRVVFLLYNHDLSAQLTPIEVLRTFLYGLKMDASMIGYIIMINGLLVSASVFIKAHSIRYAIIAVNTVFLFMSCCIVIIDMELYRHWGFRLNTTPFLYLGPEAMGSIEVLVVLKTLAVFAVLFSFATFSLIHIFSKRLPSLRPEKTKRWPTFLIIFACTALTFIPIRGSFSVAPMNTGFVYFHKSKSYANHSAINVLWNFLNSAQKGKMVIYPEDFFDRKLAKQYFESLYPKNDSTTRLLSVTKPNILLIILESFTADIIAPLGGLKGITPNFNELCKEGILFKNFYSSGDRTDKGIVSILSGYPAQPQSSIIKFPSKTQHLPYVSKNLSQHGFHTSFVYGGDIDFANMRSYLRNCAFDHITSLDDFDDSLYTSKWGVHDHYVFNQVFMECDTSQYPFFKVMLTLSSHEPFDVPMEPLIKRTDTESMFLNACHYTDKSLGDFIAKAKQQPWWENTLLLLVADHGHRYPHNKDLKTKERFHIPMLWLGGAIKKDTVIDTFASHTDIANTLLAQLGSPAEEFNFSKNIIGNSTPSFAMYFFNDGYGFVSPTNYIIYDNPGKNFFKKVGTEKELDKSKAYQQILFEDYNRR
jgi:phosphoglycerol transferase MdoB-like AlkP superfamily enzyme